MSPLQLIEERLNHWEGWACEIGRTTLFVRFDEVWRAACRVGGPLGTIYDGDLRLRTGAVTCTAGSCTCIAGIKAAKSHPDHTGPTPVRLGASPGTV